MWLFVLFESLVFTSYFCVYLYSRTQDERAFLEAQSALTLPLGILDTILLLTSSWAIARCVQHARAGRTAPPGSSRSSPPASARRSSPSRSSSGCT